MADKEKQEAQRKQDKARLDLGSDKLVASKPEGEDMKVVVDLNICDLHGLCVEAAPEVFQIGDDGALHVLIETPPDGLRAKVDKAVRECPTGAISIEE